MTPAWCARDVSTSNVIFTNLQSDCSVGAMLDVHRLRVFRSVVASGSIQAAANNLGYTPSAVSQHVTALQRETGLALISRVGRGIEPTAAGRALALEIDGVLSRLGEVESVVGDLRAGRTGSLSIAYFASVGSAWMPTVVATMMAEFPSVRLDLALREDVPTDPAERPDLQIAVEQGAIHRPGPGGAAPARRPVRGGAAVRAPAGRAGRDRSRGPGRRPLGRQRLRPGLVPAEPDRGLSRGRFQSAVPRRGARLPDGDGLRGGRDRRDRAADAGRRGSCRPGWSRCR